MADGWTAETLAAGARETVERLSWCADAGLCTREGAGVGEGSLHRPRLFRRGKDRRVSDQHLAAVSKGQGDLLDVFRGFGPAATTRGLTATRATEVPDKLLREPI